MAKTKGRQAQVNARLKALGRDERLVRGRGYFYFVGGESHEWYSSSVYVAHADHLTLNQWMWEFNNLLANGGR